mmetsp:Transcript_139050/g.387859  ORF Transcript_139050/g.387859 Transcript_139050/m.387859 type:complete len:218 (-) Transcript_139050:262-915(-)
MALLAGALGAPSEFSVPGAPGWPQLGGGCCCPISGGGGSWPVVRAPRSSGEPRGWAPVPPPCWGAHGCWPVGACGHCPFDGGADGHGCCGACIGACGCCGGHCGGAPGCCTGHPCGGGIAPHCCCCCCCGCCCGGAPCPAEPHCPAPIPQAVGAGGVDHGSPGVAHGSVARGAEPQGSVPPCKPSPVCRGGSGGACRGAAGCWPAQGPVGCGCGHGC